MNSPPPMSKWAGCFGRWAIRKPPRPTTGRPSTYANNYSTSAPRMWSHRRTLMLRAYEHLAGLEGGGLGKQSRPPRSWRPPDTARRCPLAEEGAVDPNNTVAASDYAVLLLRMASIDVPREGLPESLAMLRKAAASLELLRASGRRDLDVFSIDAYLFTGHRLLALGAVRRRGGANTNARLRASGHADGCRRCFRGGGSARGTGRGRNRASRR